MMNETERRPMMRHTIWQVGTEATPRRWPLKLSALVLLSLCVASWLAVGGAVHMLFDLVN